MCVAYPGTVIAVRPAEHKATVDFSGTTVDALTGLSDIKEGDRVLVHAVVLNCLACGGRLATVSPARPCGLARVGALVPVHCANAFHASSGRSNPPRIARLRCDDDDCVGQRD